MVTSPLYAVPVSGVIQVLYISASPFESPSRTDRRISGRPEGAPAARSSIPRMSSEPFTPFSLNHPSQVKSCAAPYFEIYFVLRRWGEPLKVRPLAARPVLLVLPLLVPL